MPHRRQRYLALGAMIAIALLAAGAIWWAIAPRKSHHLDPLFTGEVEDQPAWPPPAPADFATEVASSRAIRALTQELRFDSGIPDAGLPALEGDVPGLQVRTGWAEGLYYVEAVFGRGANFDDPMPMAVLIHGRGDRARIPGGPFWGLGAPLRVIVPQAPDPLGDGFEWLPVRVGQNLVDRLTTSMLARAGQVARMLHELRVTLPTVGKPMIVGFSQGGLLTFTLAMQHSDTVQAAFPLAAWLPPALVPAYKRDDIAHPRIRGMHGTADTVISVSPTEEVYALLQEREFDAELVLFDGVAHEMTDEMNDQLHAWLAEELGVLVDQGVRRGLLDGGVRPCAPPGWPMGAGWPDAGLPEAGWPDGSFPDAGPWWECPDGGPLDAASDAGLDAGARWSPLRRPAAAPAR
ncbi:MAG: dienelactone hydrolase family protein [Sandaracinaceae bacterium]|nr:MAG: hypothetical protein EVA89_23675 [Sandaracinaceae bacterium]